MYINLPNKTNEAISLLDNEQRGILFTALLDHVRGSEDDYTGHMTKETEVAFSFLTMWNDAAREKRQNSRVKYNPDARTSE